jgi:hypothetical protein
MPDFETRSIVGQAVELRTATDGVTVEGYAAVYNQWADIGGWFEECFAPGCFTASLRAQDDVVFLVNHDGLPLARTRSGTLLLADDARGLSMKTALDPTDPDVMEIVPKMKRGDLDKMSVAFMVTRQEWDTSGQTERRTILEAQLYDVSIVTTPAYEGTTIALRSLEQARLEGRRANYAAANRRRRMAMRLDLSQRS